MHWGDAAPEPAGEETSDAPAPLRGWKRWIANATRRSNPELPPHPSPTTERLDIRATLRVLPTLLDSASLPSGVVELLIEDFESPTRQLFDIHDGHITLVEPGAAVPWASIAGSATAWAMALGAEHNVAALHITGDEELARRVLAALPPEH